ncbi:MAG: serine/threonine-protein kinase [Myxococcota bacterium]
MPENLLYFVPVGSAAQDEELQDDLQGSVTLGRYRLVSPLAKGGMGVIYLARQEGDAGFMRPAVIKRLRPDIGIDDKMVELFMREARILSRLQHPGIVGVLDFAVEEGCHVMALEYVAGYHAGLWSRYARKRGQDVDPNLMIYVVAQVLDALDYVHTRTDEAGEPLVIVHRDVTPSNVLIDREGQVKLLDFGIARSEEEATKDASERSIKGKFSYIAPETLDGYPPSTSGDLYSCGVMLHALLWGRNYFLASTPAETLRRVLAGDLPPLEGHVAGAPPGIDEFVKQATARNPEDRFLTAAEMGTELRKLLSLDERSVAKQLQAEAKDLYQPERLPALLKQATLEDRDSLWRNYVPSTPPEKLASSAPPPPAAAKSSKLPLAVAAVAVVALSGVIAGLATRPSVEQNIVIDQSSRARGGSPGPVVIPPVPPDMTPTSAMDSSGGEEASPGPTKMRPPGGSLSASFGQSIPALRSCYELHANEDTPGQLRVRLSIGVDGLVEDALITPRRMPAPLLDCLTRVSESARFGPQSEPVRFTLPLTFRTTGG